MFGIWKKYHVVLVVIRALHLDPYSFVLKYYFASTLALTYNGVIRLDGNHNEWYIVAVNDTNLLLSKF